MKKISEINGVKTPVFGSPHFKEFVVDFNNFDKSVEQINKALLEEKIFGGKDLSSDFPQLGNSALYCVTEVHSKKDIDKLVNSLASIL
jgi:glycine dehydrogenase subunit 1